MTRVRSELVIAAVVCAIDVRERVLELERVGLERILRRIRALW